MQDHMVPYRKKRGGGSFVWKITLRQTLRAMGLFFWVDVLLIVLFWGGVLIGVEQTAAMVVGGSPQDAVFGEHFFDVNRQPGRVDDNIFHNTQLSDRFGMLPGKRELLDIGYSESVASAQWRYQITTPVSETDVMVITFTPGILWVGFVNCLSVLAGFELLCLITGLFRISRSVRRTLLPINQLTAATHQSMSAQKAPNVSRKSPELQLGSTIDVINAINEQRMDARIDVAKEREELRGLAVAINSMLDRVDSAYHSQLRFVSDASHELRTPIAVIQGYASLLDRWGKEDPKTLEESITAIRSEADSMKELVEQLLFLARSDNNSITLRMEYIDLSELVQEVARESEMIGKDHHVECPVRPALFVSGDIQLLKQALRILVDNAFKYTPENGKITLDAKEQDGMAILSVTDSGMGISSDDLSRLFDRFYRADASRARQTGGAGLGLSIAKWIVDSHGGVIEILSREGLGTRVTIKLRPALENAQSYMITTPLLETHRQD